MKNTRQFFAGAEGARAKRSQKVKGSPFTYYLVIPYLCSAMKLVDVLLLSLAAVFVIIGIYEVMTLGFGHAYWAIMLSFGFFFIYTYRKKK